MWNGLYIFSCNLDFYVVEKKTGKLKFFSFLYSPIENTIQVIFYKNYFFTPVYPHWYSIFFIIFFHDLCGARGWFQMRFITLLTSYEWRITSWLRRSFWEKYHIFEDYLEKRVCWMQQMQSFLQRKELRESSKIGSRDMRKTWVRLTVRPENRPIANGVVVKPSDVLMDGLQQKMHNQNRPRTMRLIPQQSLMRCVVGVLPQNKISKTTWKSAERTKLIQIRPRANKKRRWQAQVFQGSVRTVKILWVIARHRIRFERVFLPS